MEQRVLYRLVIMVIYLVSGFSVGICSDRLIKTYVPPSSSSNEAALSPWYDDHASSSDEVASPPWYDDNAPFGEVASPPWYDDNASSGEVASPPWYDDNASPTSSGDQMVYSAPLKVPDVSGLEWDSLVVKSPIPVMVEFVDPLCDFCDFIEPSMNQLAQEFEGKCKFYKLDISLNREIAAECGVVGYVPYFIMFKGGFRGMRIRGPATYEELMKLVTRYVKLSS